jgi:hypothetical protein
VIRRSCFRKCAVLFCTAIFAATSLASAEQSQAASTQKDAVENKTSNATSHGQPADLSGDWQVSWEVRLGTDSGTLHLQQNGTKLTGTLKDLHGLSPVSGTVDETRISFDVQFQGKYPFTTRFTGRLNNGKLEGTSEAIGVTGGGGAFLGHGGEVVHPEHPWTATRVVNGPAHAGEASSTPNPSVRK